MKKLIAILAAVMCSLFCVKVHAEEIINNSITDGEKSIYDIIYEAVETTKYEIDYYDSYFKETESPNERFIISHFIWSYEFKDYIVNIEEKEQTDEYGTYIETKEEYLVPVEIFDDSITKKFNVSDETLEYLKTFEWTDHEQIFYKGIIEKEGQHYYSFYTIIMNYGMGYGDTWVQFLGYQDLGNNTYEAYSYLYDTHYVYESEKDDYVEYKPKQTDEYGKDYVIRCDDDGCYAMGISNVVKIKLKIVDKDVKFLAYEKIDNDKIADNLIKVMDTPLINTKTDNVNVTAKEGTFIEGSQITIEKQEKGSIFDVASKALKEKFSTFVIYEINAKAGDYDVEPNGKVEISIKVPEGYKNPVIYYVTEDGKLEKLETKVKDGYAIAEVTHFSTYALVDEKVTISEKVEEVVDKVVESVVENPKTGIIGGAGVVALAGGCGAYIYHKSKKKNKFPQS